MANDRKQERVTRLLHAGGSPFNRSGIVNTPVYRASTVLFPNVEALDKASADPFNGVYYGRHGTPTTFAFEDAVAELDGADRCIAVSSGLAAITTVLMGLLKAGDHLLMVDSVYGPTRGVCDGLLASFGVETEYYAPRIGAEIERLIRPETRLIFTESPGSLTFELQDIPAISKVAKAHNVLVAIDNTWATPLYFSAMEHGADIVVHAATKYMVGHSDAMLGAISCNENLFTGLKKTAVALGSCAGSEECYLGLRGLRTLPVRLAEHQRNAMAVASWLEKQPAVETVRYPALKASEDFELWSRDFSGASGLMGVVLRYKSPEQVNAFVDALTLFGIGFSWGGYESLVLPTDKGIYRTASGDTTAGTVRLHIGLEAVDDIIADLAHALSQLPTFEK